MGRDIFTDHYLLVSKLLLWTRWRNLGNEEVREGSNKFINPICYRIELNKLIERQRQHYSNAMYIGQCG